jgi:hypothetical protein
MPQKLRGGTEGGLSYLSGLDFFAVDADEGAGDREENDYDKGYQARYGFHDFVW